MKTKEDQINALAKDYAEKQYPNDRNTHMMATFDAFKSGCEQAQKDAQEREAKLVECVKFYADEANWNSGYDHSYIVGSDETKSRTKIIGGKTARELLKELGVE